jgi:hypothetical protein
MHQTPRRGRRPLPARDRPEEPSATTGSGGSARCWRLAQPRPGSKDICRNTGCRFIPASSRPPLLYQRRRRPRKCPTAFRRHAHRLVTSTPLPPDPTQARFRMAVLLSSFHQAARVGPERHCRERRGPPAGGGLGSRGAIRARKAGTARGKASASLAKQLERIARSGSRTS